MLNIGDIIFQLFVFLIPIVIIVAIIYFVRSSKKRKEQLDRIEEKLDRASGQTQKNRLQIFFNRSCFYALSYSDFGYKIHLFCT